MVSKLDLSGGLNHGLNLHLNIPLKLLQGTFIFLLILADPLDKSGMSTTTSCNKDLANPCIYMKAS